MTGEMRGSGIMGRLAALLMIGSVLGVVPGTGTLGAQTVGDIELVTVQLISDSTTIVPGRPTTIGLHLKMAPGWHTYWEYSGDSGLPITLNLQLPDGFRATELQWPLPLRMVEPGDLEVYGYKDEVLLLMRIFPPADIDASKVVLTGTAEWLVCESICLPGEGAVALELAVGTTPTPSQTELFARFRDQLPQPLRGRPGEPVRFSWERTAEALRLNVEGPKTWTYDFFPLPASSSLLLGHPVTSVSPDRDRAVVEIPLLNAPADLSLLPGVLVAEEKESGKRHGWRLGGR